MKRKSPSPPAVVTLKRNPKASGMAQLLRKTDLFLLAKRINYLIQSKEYQKKTYQIVKKTSRSGLIAASERQSFLLNILLLKQREM